MKSLLANDIVNELGAIASWTLEENDLSLGVRIRLEQIENAAPSRWNAVPTI